MSCEGAIYKSAGSRSVQAEHKRNARPLDADTALRSIREAEENSKTRSSYTADGLRAWRASSRYRQFSVLNPFPCSCSYPREASRNRAPGKKIIALFRACLVKVFVFVVVVDDAWPWIHGTYNPSPAYSRCWRLSAPN